MSTQELLEEIKKLPDDDLQILLSHIFADEKILQEVERMGYLRLAERALEFWNDPREDQYQDYARPISQEDKSKQARSPR